MAYVQRRVNQPSSTPSQPPNLFAHVANFNNHPGLHPGVVKISAEKGIPAVFLQVNQDEQINVFCPHKGDVLVLRCDQDSETFEELRSIASDLAQRGVTVVCVDKMIGYEMKKIRCTYAQGSLRCTNPATPTDPEHGPRCPDHRVL